MQEILLTTDSKEILYEASLDGLTKSENLGFGEINLWFIQKNRKLKKIFRFFFDLELKKSFSVNC